jgi:hypothetical protein
VGRRPRETASLTFVTLPAVEATIAQLRQAMARLEAREEPPRGPGSWYRLEAGRQLERKVLDGWIERPGLGGLPIDGCHTDNANGATNNSGPPNEPQSQQPWDPARPRRASRQH